MSDIFTIIGLAGSQRYQSYNRARLHVVSNIDNRGSFFSLLAR